MAISLSASRSHHQAPGNFLQRRTRPMLAATFNRLLAQTQAMIGSFNQLSGVAFHADSLIAAAGRARWTPLPEPCPAPRSSSARRRRKSARPCGKSRRHPNSPPRGASEVARGSASQAASISEGSELVKQLASAVHGVARDAEVGGTGHAWTRRKPRRPGPTRCGRPSPECTPFSAAISDSAQVVQTLGSFVPADRNHCSDHRRDRRTNQSAGPECRH